MNPSMYHLLRASAGTGKTYQLVEAYVALVLEHNLRPSQIVTITFTRKAAAELRGRLRRRLTSAGVAPALLSELAHAPISNFHGLALQLLRQFGPAAGFGAGSTVLGEPGADAQLFWQACEDAWFGGTQATAEALTRAAHFLGVDWDLPAALWQAIGRAREDGQPINRQLLGAYSPQAVQTALHQQLLALRQRLDDATAAQTGVTRDKLNAFLAVAAPSLPQAVEAWTHTWRQAFGHLDRRGALGRIYSEDDKLLLTERLPEVQAETLCAQLVDDMGTLLEAAWQQYEAVKTRERALDFADLVERLVHALGTQPALHTQVRERFAAVLVDEAQDTNLLQRHMVHLLAGLSGPVTEVPARLLVVGDWKQSIYTFRGADPQSFALFADDLKSRGGSEATLSVSRRSRAALVAGINHVGTHVFAETYEPLAPLPSDEPDISAEAPAPAMHWYDVDTSVQEPRAVAQIIAARLQKGAAPGDFALLLATMSQAPLFARALSDYGVPVVLGGGGDLYQQTEIVDLVALLAWLCHPWDRLSAAIALRSPLVGLSDSALMHVLHDTHLYALRRGALSPVTGGLPEDNAMLAHVNALIAQLVRAVQSAGPGALVEQVEALLDMRAVYLALDGGEQRVANLQRFIDMANQAEFAGVTTKQFVRQQVSRMQRGHAEPLMPVSLAERHAVTISSVHQSKGLQYPVVLLANLDRRGRNDVAAVRYGRQHGLVFRPRGASDGVKTARWRDTHEADQRVARDELRRLLYVAVTRAEQQVLFVGPKAASMAKAGFGQLVGSWVESACAAGVLQRQLVPDIEPGARASTSAEAALPADAALRAADALWQQMAQTTVAPGTHFAITVTELERAVLPATSAERVGGLPRASAAAPAILNPLDRGRLAHAVLAGLERRVTHASSVSFVASELQRAGFDPEHADLQELTADVLSFLESPLGAAVTRLDASARRHELPFQLGLAVEPYHVTLHGQIDLLFWDSEGPVVVDFKHARADPGSLAAYELQLSAYALAVAKMCQISGPIRTRLVFLRDRGRPHDHIVTADMRAAVAHAAHEWVRHRVQTAL